MNPFQRLQNLYEEELYSNAHELGSFFLSNPALFGVARQEELFGTFVINGCSLWELKNYTEAQEQFKTAIIIRRQLQPVVKLSPNLADLIEKFTEVELKFRMAKCMVETNQAKEAAGILQPIPLKQRSAKINWLLVKIQQGEAGTDKHMIANFKEVLRKTPVAIECVDGLINLGVKGTEVNSLIINASSTENFEWMNLYIRGMSEMHTRKFAEAIETFKSIDCLRNNSKIQALIGEAFYYSGDYDNAYQALKKAYELNPFMKHGVQKFAMLCDMYKKSRELEQLLRPSSSYPYEYTSENWFVMAIYLYSCMKFEKAQYFINRVIVQHQSKNTDALILSAKILHTTKKSNEALVALRQALKYEPHRFEVHRWIIEILLNTDRARDAQNQSTKTLKLLGENPRSLTLAASTYLKNPISKDKAKQLLQRALEMNEYYTKAVFFLAQILIDDKEHKAATKLLEKTSKAATSVKLSLMLADLHAKSKNLSQALELYTKVLNTDSNNRHALNGLMALGTPNNSLEKALEVSTTTCGENDDSSAEIEQSGSSRMKTNDDDDDSELVWSDEEMEVT